MAGILYSALLTPNNSFAAMYFVHGDNQNTPKVITNQSQQVVWKGDSSPFGETDISTEIIENNVRFPGQYFDWETGLHYNYYRDYDPNLGRYIQSDPIGVIGGVNVFAYGNNNPLIYTDPNGLTAVFSLNQKTDCKTIYFRTIPANCCDSCSSTSGFVHVSTCFPYVYYRPPTCQCGGSNGIRG